MFSYTAPETVGGVNGPFHTTVSVEGLRFADLFEVDGLVVIERNGLAAGPMPREYVVPLMASVVKAMALAELDQMNAEARDGFDGITVNQLLDAEFGHDGAWYL